MEYNAPSPHLGYTRTVGRGILTLHLWFSITGSSKKMCPCTMPLRQPPADNQQWPTKPEIVIAL